MKSIFVVSLTIILGACSTHAVKCRAPLRPINKPAMQNTPSSGSQLHPPPRDGQKHDEASDTTSRTEPRP